MCVTTGQRSVSAPNSGEFMNFEKVSIYIGATDENEGLKKTVDYIMETCDINDIDRVVMVYPKRAAEQCVNAIEMLSRKYPGKVFGMMQTRPYIGGGIRDGFDSAASSHIMLLPGDLGVSLDCIPRMINGAKAEPETIIKTSRWLKKGSFHEYDPTRKMFNRLAQIFLKILFLSDLTDFTLPVQTMPTELYKSIDFRELNFPFLIELVVAPLRIGAKFREIPVECMSRTEGKSKNSFRQTALYLKTALRVRFSSKKKLIKR